MNTDKILNLLTKIRNWIKKYKSKKALKKILKQTRHLRQLNDLLQDSQDIINKKNVEINEMRKVSSEKNLLPQMKSDAQIEYEKERKEWDDRHG